MLNKRDQKIYDLHRIGMVGDSDLSTRDLNMLLKERNRINGTNIKPCKECRDDHRSNYDDHVILVSVKWELMEPTIATRRHEDTYRRFTRAYICLGHRRTMINDGYTVTKL